MADVSVIIPVYNAEKTLRRCVESIVFGTYRNVEVILVEDHSADGSWALCQKLAQQFRNVLTLRNDRNRGVSHTRNRGLDAATGDYILFCDSDDWVSDNYIQVLLEQVNTYPNAFVCCGYTKCYSDTTKDVLLSKQKSDIVKKEEWFSLMDQELIQYVWNKCFDRKVIQKAGLRFDEGQYMGEDFQFVLDYINAARCQSFCILNNPLYFYAQTNPQSLVSRWSRVENLEQAICRIRQLALIVEDQAMGEQKIQELKKSFVYLIARDRRRTRRERVRDIEFVMCDGCAPSHYRNQRWNYCKEKIAATIKACRITINSNKDKSA